MAKPVRGEGDGSLWHARGTCAHARARLARKKRVSRRRRLGPVLAHCQVMTHIVLPKMEEAKRGAIVNISSASGCFSRCQHSSSRRTILGCTRCLNCSLCARRGSKRVIQTCDALILPRVSSCIALALASSRWTDPPATRRSPLLAQYSATKSYVELFTAGPSHLLNAPATLSTQCRVCRSHPLPVSTTPRARRRQHGGACARG